MLTLVGVVDADLGLVGGDLRAGERKAPLEWVGRRGMAGLHAGTVVVAFSRRAVIGLAGLFIAHAWEEGALHSAGIALFAVSGAMIFLDMKHVFDRMEPPGH